MDQGDQPKPELVEKRKEPRLTPEDRDKLHREALVELFTNQITDVIERRVSVKDYVNNKVEEHIRLEQLAGLDGMTGLLNRRMCEEQAEGLVATEQGHDHPMSIILLDIDHFKSVNDEFGHPVGDKVLKAMGGALQRFIGEKKENVVGRWGGEEFFIGIPHLEGEELDERMKGIRNEAIQAMSGVLGRPVTVSMGAIEVGKKDKFTALLRKVDEALYLAKRVDKDGNSRNRGMVVRKNQEVDNAIEVAFG